MPQQAGSQSSREGDENNTVAGGDENNNVVRIFPNLGMRGPAGAAVTPTSAGAGDDAKAAADTVHGSADACTGPAGPGPAAGTNPGGQVAPEPSRIDQAYDAITLALQGTDMAPEVRVKDQDNSGKTAKQVARAKATEGDRYRGWLCRAERIEGEAEKTEFWRKQVRLHRERDNALAQARARQAQQQGQVGQEDEAAVAAVAAGPAQQQQGHAVAAAPGDQHENYGVGARDGHDDDNRLIHLGHGVILWHGRIRGSFDA